MTRPQATAKMGYYPTPDDQVHLFKQIITPPDEQQPGIVTVLDNFAGKGKIAAELAMHLVGHPYLVELDEERAGECRQITTTMGGETLHGPAESLKTTGGFSVWIFNPPYDTESVEHGRLEVYLWHKVVKSAAKPGTLCILILPAKVVANESFAREIYRWIETPVTRRFTSPAYEVFHQVVVMGYARAKPLLLQDIAQSFYGKADMIYPRDTLASSPLHYKLRNFEPVTEFVNVLPNWDELIVEADTAGVLQSKAWANFIRPRVGMGAFRPLMQLSAGKTALLTAAGLANSTLIGDDVIKGSTRIYIQKIERTKQAEGGRVVPQIVEKQKYAQVLTMFNTRTGDLRTLDSHDTPEAYTEYVKEHAQQLTDNITEKYPPLYDGNLLPWADLIGKIHSPKRLKGVADGLLPLQAHTACAIATGMKIGRSFNIVGEMGTGKAQPLTAKILTPAGWTTMGQLKIGDPVIGSDGQAYPVLGIYPQGIKPIFRVTFSDGGQTECTDEHLWQVNTPLRKWKGKPALVLPLSALRTKLTHINGNRQFFVPVVQPVRFVPGSLPLSPYLLGALLGDGGLSVLHQVKFTSADEQIVAMVDAELPIGVHLYQHSPYDYSIVRDKVGRYSVHPVLQALRKLGLMGQKSGGKFIPDAYLFSSVLDRVALLQGLLDTDGSVANEDGTAIEYTTISSRLADNFVELVRSLGGTATYVRRTTHYTHKDEYLTGQPSYRIHLRLPESIAPFRLIRKLAKYNPHTKYRAISRSIVSVEPVGSQPAQCIQTGSPDHLYVTDDYILTHNTTQMIATMLLASAPAVRRGEGFKCFFWTPGHLVRKVKREILAVLAEFHVKVIIIGEERNWPGMTKKDKRPLIDVQNMMKMDGIVFGVLSKEVAKNGTPWAGRAARKTRVLYREEVIRSVDGPRTIRRREKIRVMVCPDCGKQVLDERGNPLYEFPKDKKGKEKHRWRCDDCNAPLFTMGEADGSYTAYAAYDEAFQANDWDAYPPRTPELGKRQIKVGFRRFPVAEYISQHYAGRYGLIIDEVHQTKSEDADQAFASVDLAFAAKQVVCGTGTIFGGKATTLFYLLYRNKPWFRKLYGYKEVKTFVEHFGLSETVYTGDRPVRRSDSSMGYARNDDWTSETHEIPGAHPVMASFLLDSSAFMRLEDMGVRLPAYTEMRVPVSLGAYEGTVQASLESLRRQACTIKAQGFSAFQHAAIGWPDLPQAEEFVFKDETTARLPELVTPGDGEWPKVQTVANMIRDERDRARRSIIYLEQVHRRDSTDLYLQALHKRGLKTYNLRSTTKGEERESAIEQAANDDVDVMVTNGSLVETGLDLVYFSSIYRVQPIVSPYREIQQDRRIWRLGQENDCFIYWVYYSYPGSVQELTVALMARKLRAMLLLNGDIAEGLAATEDNDDSFLQDMLRMLADARGPDWSDLPGLYQPPAPMIDDRLLIWPEVTAIRRPIVSAPPPALLIPPAAPKVFPKQSGYELRSFGNGVLELKGPGAPMRVTWLGGNRLSGNTQAVAHVREHFAAALASRNPTKKWTVQARA